MILIAFVAACIAIPFIRIAIADHRHREQLSASIAKREAYFKARDPHCDGCARDLGHEPIRPVMRCGMHCSAVAGLVGDPLFGFDFEKYKTDKA